MDIVGTLIAVYFFGIILLSILAGYRAHRFLRYAKARYPDIAARFKWASNIRSYSLLREDYSTGDPEFERLQTWAKVTGNIVFVCILPPVLLMVLGMLYMLITTR